MSFILKLNLITSAIEPSGTGFPAEFSLIGLNPWVFKKL
jgi:hypothetical protein